MRRLKLADTEQLRAQPGRSVLLYITDQCPVECRHCSVDAVADGPRITDWPVFEATVRGMAALPGVEVTAISGGEPFVERRGLPFAVDRFREAGQHVVIFTSGYWAAEGRRSAAWIRGVLAHTATVFLSTDAFHDERIPVRRFTAALSTVADAGAHIVVQLLDDPATVEAASGALHAAFGDDWPRYAEINRITPLRRGRGAEVFHISRRRRLDELGSCGLLGSPTIRYDGIVTPCCNESLITGAGPDGLRRRVRTPDQVAEALRDFRADPMLRLLGTVGPKMLPLLPGFSALETDRYEDVCGACWSAYAIRDRDPSARRAVALAGDLVSAGTGTSGDEGDRP